jgi:hypothetical protein
MSNSNSSSSGGIGFGGALFVLRLAGVINWPWIWVFAPIWSPLALLSLGVIVLALCGVFNR